MTEQRKDYLLLWAFVVFAMLVFVCFLTAHVAWSHNASRPELNKWFDGLKSGKGACCSDADGTAITDADWASVSDTTKPRVHYKVFIEQQWVDVPDDAVIKEPNLDGRTIVWPLRTWGPGNGLAMTIRCFIPGVMG
jgi:hypothetical protein